MTAEGIRTHLIVLWGVRPDGRGPMRAAADDSGKLILFSELEPAVTFAGRLEAYGLVATPFPVSMAMVAELLAENGTHDENSAIVFEAQTTGPGDAIAWAQELADRSFTRLAAAFEAGVNRGTGG